MLYDDGAMRIRTRLSDGPIETYEQPLTRGPIWGDAPRILNKKKDIQKLLTI